MTPVSKAPGSTLLKLSCDGPLSHFAFNVNLRRYSMAYIMEKAGGRATDGENRILDIQPTHIHQRVPIHMGSAEDIQAGSYTRPLFIST